MRKFDVVICAMFGTGDKVKLESSFMPLCRKVFSMFPDAGHISSITSEKILKILRKGLCRPFLP